MVARQRGSVRFDPYYKVQVWDTINLAWRDIQRAYPSVPEALAARPRGRTCRLMEITMQGRHPLPQS
jgi:hypothetical protein